MKRILMLAACFTVALSSYGQERLSREETLKYAFLASANLKEMLATPIATDPDVKRPVAVRDGDYGGLVFPETKLSADVFAKAGKDASSVGQIWLVKVVPLTDGQVVPAGKLRFVKVQHQGEDVSVACCALGVSKKSDGSLELLVYGKGTEPVLRAPIKAISSKQENPVELAAERTSDGGLITLKFLGKYEASFMVTDPSQY